MVKPRARERFSNDLDEAKVPSRFTDIVNVNRGGDGESMSFTYVSAGLPHGQVTIQALVPELSEYPDTHEYMLFTTDDHVPRSFAAGLEHIQAQLRGLRLCQMLDKLSRHLEKLLAEDTLPDADAPFDVEDVDEDGLEDEYEEEDYNDDDDDDDDEIWSPKSAEQVERKNGFGSAENVLKASQTKKSQILADLRRVKGAGFKVGIVGPLMHTASSGHLCISIRVSKLGISDEALQAWNVDRRRYLVLLIYYPQGYRDITQMSQDDRAGNSGVEMRVGLCHSYKPSRSAAVQAFTKTVKGATSSIMPTEYKPDDLKEEDKFHLMFLSQSLRGLLNERLFKILRYRLSMNFGWGGAELFYNDNQCKARPDPCEVLSDKYFEEDNVQSSMSLVKLVTADHLAQAGDQASFPLVAMQFVLRHFVRCTEFCLVCHCKVKADFEALKPYVCENGLCLYQYMSLGFGPSIEWEIMSQPYVVDLLISFCYASARGGRLKDFPLGLDLQVPPIVAGTELSLPPENYHLLHSRAKATEVDPGKPGLLLWEPNHQNARFNSENSELIFSNSIEKSPVKDGDWIVIQDPLQAEREFHCRVMETALFPTVKVGHMIFRGKGAADSPGVVSDPSLKTTDESVWTQIWFNKYSVHFDEITITDKQRSICQILDTLPDVRQMKEYLLRSQRHRSEPSLSHWNQRISPTALNLLRWVIASNRSCLLQVDDMAGSEKDSGQIHTPAPEDRVYGMGQWMQFRFAQGAPDKEQRFVNAVKLTTERLNLQYPTIFAWHGSPLSNWHGIVREGLHFKDQLHGRAFGHGVYMSNHFATSGGYSGMEQQNSHPWPRSKLRITSALALNEVVNAPAEYVSSNPHYVVQHVDWIQTRYLFVQCKASDRPLTVEKQPQRAFAQDPARVVKGETGSPIVIPITAVSKCRRSTTSPRSSESGNKRAKIEVDTDEEQAQREEDDRHSVATNLSDLEVFFASDDEDDDLREIPKKEFERDTYSSRNLPPQTDFVEQSLDITTLPMLAPPSYATTVATKALQRALRETLAAQESTPVHELGWYVNSDHINNMYQWIVELHSFDPKLPLSIDMKAKDIKSIVLELRFTSSFPYAPPFVRVIRPRFLPFQQGGGGHVTAGGALCMELLTSSGWSAVNNIESVLLQVRMAISSLEPKPARLDTHGRHDYGISEAVDAYVRACHMHGWKIPDGFTSFSMEGASRSGARDISGSGLVGLNGY